MTPEPLSHGFLDQSPIMPGTAEFRPLARNQPPFGNPSNRDTICRMSNIGMD